MYNKEFIASSVHNFHHPLFRSHVYEFAHNEVNEPLIHLAMTGAELEPEEAAKYVAKIKEAGFELVSETTDLTKERTFRSDGYNFFHKETKTFLEILYYAHTQSVYFNFFGYQKALETEKIKELIEYFRVNLNLEAKAAQGTVYALTTTSNGNLTISPIGNNGKVISRENYSPKALEGYDYIVEQFNAAEPDGRIAIFDGKPGTGKTYLVRSLLMDIKNTDMIILPASLVASFNMPQMLSTLVNHKEEYGNKIILMIEDADEVIAKRGMDNMSAVSNLLNLGDGILGSVLDIRIICTTNASVKDLDDAIMRPGRLCKHVTVPPLDREQAKALVTKLSKNADIEMPNSSYTLAEVYKIAKDAKFKVAKEKGKFGF